MYTDFHSLLNFYWSLQIFFSKAGYTFYLLCLGTAVTGKHFTINPAWLGSVICIIIASNLLTAALQGLFMQALMGDNYNKPSFTSRAKRITNYFSKPIDSFIKMGEI